MYIHLYFLKSFVAWIGIVCARRGLVANGLRKKSFTTITVSWSFNLIFRTFLCFYHIMTALGLSQAFVVI